MLSLGDGLQCLCCVGRPHLHYSTRRPQILASKRRLSEINAEGHMVAVVAYTTKFY